MIELTDKKYKVARERHYITHYDIVYPREWQITFVGAFVIKYPNRIGLLDKIAQSFGKTIPMWEDFTEDNLRILRNNMTKGKKTECANSVRTDFLRIKSVLNENKSKLPISSDVYSDILTCKGEPSQAMSLTEEEIEQLSNVETMNENEKYVHCVFMISCYTGCRHSDAIKIQEENLISGTFTYVSEKTSAEVVLPIHKNMHKYVGHYDINNQMTPETFNRIIKKLCKRANINTKVKVFHAGKESVGEKWEFITSHSARRSFCTNLFLRGVDADTIAPLAGHRDSSVTKRYICAKRPISEKALEFFK